MAPIEARYEETPEGTIGMYVNGQLLGYAADQVAAEIVVQEYRDAIQEAAEAFAGSLQALWASYPPEVRARWNSRQ